MSQGDAAVGVPTGTLPGAGVRQPAATPVLELSGQRGTIRGLLRALWTHRFLLAMLARKDFFVRYRRATLGVLWAVGLPLIQALVLAVVFTHVVRIETGTNQAVFMFTGVTAYAYFQATVTQAATSIVDGAGLTSRIYFPRAVLPLTAVVANAYALVAGLFVLLVMAAVFQVGLGVHTLLLVPSVLLLLMLTASTALVLSALHVYFRDVRYIVQAILLALFYGTPVIYPLDFVPERLRLVIMCNPMTGVVEMFRKSIAGEDPQWAAAAGITVGWAVFFLIIGLYLHSRWDRLFVDLL